MRTSRFPDDGTALVRRVIDLERRMRETAAAPRGSNTAISGDGGLTLLGADGQRITLAPTSPTGITLPGGAVITPPAIALLSAASDFAAGVLTTYRKPTVLGSVPVAALVSPQAGPTTAALTLQGGEDGGESALAGLAAAGAALTLTPTGLTLVLPGGATLEFTAGGLRVSGATTSPGWAEDTVSTTCTATSFADAVSGPFSASVTVPPSGRVVVSVRCTQRASGTLNAFTSWRGVGSVSGTAYTENLPAALPVNGAANQSPFLRHPLTGLTPGETITVTTKHRLNAAGTQTIDYRSIYIETEPTP
ncbi:hypothetical protein AB4225_06025 [Streptomyces sp. 2RAF24]|uniref:hypothetical protein n=1 Tax=Streptomyces sp. 2RAF24 TaxID=3232997 RepID=UPI003F961E0B